MKKISFPNRPPISSGQTHLILLRYCENQYLCAQILNIYNMESPLSYFSGIKNPRIDRTKAHLLEDIIVITILPVLCGADTWDDMEDFGKSKESWLRGFLKLSGGIPSHDTFNRVFSLLDPKALKECFINGQEQ
jgi:hypothetical protein